MKAVIQTERLILRPWSDEDRETYFYINQDPKVVEFLPGPLTKKQVQEFISSANNHFNIHGYTLWATELKESGELIGFIGLHDLDWLAPFTPAIEVGWRLRSKHWGRGYATEGAKASLNYGFDKCGLKEIISIISFTVPANERSIRVMEKIGMQRDWQGDFAHPKLPPNHRLSKHILYRVKR